MEAHLQSFLDSLAERNLSERTVWQYAHKLRAFCRWLEDRHPTEQLLHQYRLFRQLEGKRPRTMRCDFSAIWAFFEWLTKTGRAADLPKRGSVKLPTMDDVQRARFNESDVAKLVEAAEKMPQHTDRKRFLRGRALGLLAVMAGAGLRRAEALALDVQDIRRDMEPVHIHVRMGKGAQPGFVPLGDDAREHLEEWLAVRHRWCKQHGYDGGALFPVDTRRRLSDRGLDTIWDELIELAGLGGRGLTPHSLRHWYGTRVNREVDLPTASKLLRHKRLETTLQYLGTDEEKMQAGANAISFRPPARTTDSQHPHGSQSPGSGQDTRRLRRRPSTFRR